MPRTGKGAVQGYNARALACTGQIILAAEITQQTNDYGLLAPMLEAASHTLARGRHRTATGAASHTGYWSSPQIAALKARDIQAIVPVKASLRKTRPKTAPRQGPEAKRIEALLASPTALRSTANDNRSSSRASPTQVPARHRPVPPPRTGRMPLRMVADRCHT